MISHRRMKSIFMSTTFVSYLNAATGDSVVTGPVPIEPLDCDSGNVYPKMKDRINETAWELWYFDGGTEDGKTAITISFFRDARGLKDGGFRTQIFAMWPDGTKWNTGLFFAESIVTAEGYSPVQAEIHGVWKTVDDAASATFTVAADLSTAMLKFAVPNKASGTLEMSATSGSKAGLPSTEEEALLSPGMYYMRPISLADVSADLTFDMEPSSAESERNENAEQRRLNFQSGKGGMGRCWTTLSWPQIMTESYFLRATVGPYNIQLIRIISDATRGYSHHTLARLWKGQDLVCAAQQVVDRDTAETRGFLGDAVIVEKIYEVDENEGVAVAGGFRDKNVGYIVEFLQGSTPGNERNKKWRFKIRHNQSWWNMPTSAPGPQATGNSGFLEAASGGLDGETCFEGCGGCGQVQLQ